MASPFSDHLRRFIVEQMFNLSHQHSNRYWNILKYRSIRIHILIFMEQKKMISFAFITLFYFQSRRKKPLTQISSIQLWWFRSIDTRNLSFFHAIVLFQWCNKIYWRLLADVPNRILNIERDFNEKKKMEGEKNTRSTMIWDAVAVDEGTRQKKTYTQQLNIAASSKNS